MSSRAFAAVLSALFAVFIPTRVRGSFLADSPPESIASLAPARLVGGAGGGAGSIGRPPTGLFVGTETGWTLALPSKGAPAYDGWGFGLSTGYQFSMGLALLARFDDLGVRVTTDRRTALCGMAGVRYVAPMFPMPFAEVVAGPVFAGSRTLLGAGFGIGLSIPIVRHLAVNATARDWVVNPDSTVHQIVEFQVGLTVGFGGRGH